MPIGVYNSAKYRPVSAGYFETIGIPLLRGRGETPDMRTIVLAAFSILALAIASVGIYGVMNYLESQRIREFGIRVAMGATAGDVLRLVLRQAAVLIAAGLILGLLGSALFARLITGLLFGVSAMDPLTFVAVALLLSAVALLASYIPARRATRVDPLTALRFE